MKKLILLAILVSYIPISCFSQDTTDRYWDFNSAYTLPESRTEIGIFNKMSYGFTDNIQLSLNPIIFFVMPNIDVKWNHGKFFDTELSTVHTIYYPTMLMRMVSKKGLLGMIGPEFYIPHMVSIANEILATKEIDSKYFFTGKLGFNFSIHEEKPDILTTIDLPYIYPRMSVFYNGFIFNAGILSMMKLNDSFRFYFDNELILIPRAENNIAYENRGGANWMISNHVNLSLGYMLLYGDYPFGTQWHLLPTFDILFGFNL